MTRRRALLAALVASGLVIIGCSQDRAEPRRATSCRVSAHLVSGCGVWWGAFVAPTGGPVDLSDRPILDLERRIGRRLAIVHRYHDMSTGLRGTFPDAAEQRLAKDRLLFVAWASRVYGGADYTWKDVAEGNLDATVIDVAAVRVKAFGRPLFLDFDHEPETPHPNHGSDEDFAAAFRHIHDRFTTLGVTNVQWVWTLTGFAGQWDRYAALYPGDDVVDWVAWDPYDFATCHQTRRLSFAETIGPFYDWLTDHHPNKPLMLAEYGTVPDPEDPASSARWYGEVVPALKDHPRIRAVVQFDHRPGGHGGSVCDTRLRPDSVLRAWADAGHDSYVNPPLPR